VNQEGQAYADNGVIACNHIELSDEARPRVQNCYTTGGISLQRTRNWVLRNNYIAGFWCEIGLSAHGIHIWKQNADTIIESNYIADCTRGIGLGTMNSSDEERVFDDISCAADHYADDYNGLVVNNIVINTDPRVYGSVSSVDSGISLWNACNARVYHNTIFRSQEAFSSLELRWEGTIADVKNNLMTATVMRRGSPMYESAGNFEMAPEDFYVDAPNGDVHLMPSAMCLDTGVRLEVGVADVDIDGDLRDAAPDPGADEIVAQ